jgi:hypothetical protein
VGRDCDGKRRGRVKLKFGRREERRDRVLPHQIIHHLQTSTTPSPEQHHPKPPEMAEQSIKSIFSSAERQRQDIESSWDTNTSTYQQNLAAAIATYDDCLKLADRLSLFSPNETLEDITSGDLQ